MGRQCSLLGHETQNPISVDLNYLGCGKVSSYDDGFFLEGCHVSTLYVKQKSAYPGRDVFHVVGLRFKVVVVHVLKNLYKFVRHRSDGPFGVDVFGYDSTLYLAYELRIGYHHTVTGEHFHLVSAESGGHVPIKILNFLSRDLNSCTEPIEFHLNIVDVFLLYLDVLFPVDKNPPYRYA